jgi:radical SAM superfamily enzyme YgiQ (UPF0313 family)
MVFKIMLIHPPIALGGVKATIEKLHNVSAPLGLAYLAAMVKDLPVWVKIVDANLQQMTLQQIEEELREFKPDLVGMGITTASAKACGAIAKAVKQNSGKAIVVVGGPHVVATGSAMLQVFKEIDILIPGDAEEAFRELVQALLAGKPLSNCRGIIFRRKGKIAKTKEMPLLPLDQIPFPAWEMLPALERYSFQPATYRRKPQSFIVASRGCPYRCTFCHISRFRPKIRFRSPGNIVEELRILNRDYGIKEFRFADEIFTINKKWCYEICDRIIKKKLDISWTCDARADHMTVELAKKLHAAGCWSVSMGIESGSQRVLDRIKKDITLQQVRDAVLAAHKGGLGVRAFFMLGFPFETKEDIERTIAFAKSCGLDFCQFSFVIPFPGTEIFDICRKKGLFGKNGWLDYNASEYTRPVCLPEGITEQEMMRYFKRAYREFYLRPKLWFSYIKSIRGFTDIKRYYTGFKALMEN